MRRPAKRDLWIAAERWPLVKAVFPYAQASPWPSLPEALRKEWEASEAIVPLVRGRLQCAGPVTAAAMAADLDLPTAKVEAALVALEGEGTAMRGSFTLGARSGNAVNGSDTAIDGSHNGRRTSDTLEWCDRRLLARIHRLTLEGLRRQIQPVESGDFLRFLVRHQRLLPKLHWQSAAGLREAIRQLQGFEMAAGAWEQRVLPARIAQYDPAWLERADAFRRSDLGKAATTGGRRRGALRGRHDPRRADLTAHAGRSALDSAASARGGRVAAAEQCARGVRRTGLARRSSITIC